MPSSNAYSQEDRNNRRCLLADLHVDVSSDLTRSKNTGARTCNHSAVVFVVVQAGRLWAIAGGGADGDAGAWRAAAGAAGCPETSIT